jgi:hypothetical protein
MSAEARNPVGVWTSLEGSVVNGVFPLHRFLGGSDRSGVFLTESAKRTPPEVAIKLVPVIATPAEIQLSLWLTAAELSHPHLLRIYEAGRCEIDGLHYLYAVMEYADQTLSQILERRALTEDEARELLIPTLDALGYLHEKGFVHGHLKPSNIFAVGDVLKISNDTNRVVDEVGERPGTLSVYHAPEARDGRCSTAGDVWALGVTMCEVLTRRQPSGLRGTTEGAGLPTLSPEFREFVARCVRRSPHDRPEVAELAAWVRGKPLAPPPPPPIPDSAAMALLETPVPPPASAAVAKVAEHDPAHLSKARMLAIMLGAFVVFVLVWAGLRALSSTPAPIVPPPVAEPARKPVTEAASVLPPIETSVRPDPVLYEEPAAVAVSPAPVAPATVVPTRVAPTPAPAEKATSSTAIREVIPEIPLRASRTIRGTIRVSVRVIVAQDGSVFAALTDNAGPSEYFERLAIDAAKQWTFPPAEKSGQRLMLLRFAFTRDGATASAVPVR